jgi:hypothetical protein
MWDDFARKAPIVVFMIFVPAQIVLVLMRSRSGQTTVIDQLEERYPAFRWYFSFVRRFRVSPFYAVYGVVFGIVVEGVLTYFLVQS